MSEIKHPVFRSPVVMLIDDQALVANCVKNLLKNNSDIVLHYCPEPSTAIAQALRIKPTVILLDLIMPNIDGLTLCRVFRDTQETADIPIIMLSANDDGLTKAQSFDSGANDYLVKLPEETELVARIRYHSKSYTIKLERDEAYEALCRSQLALEVVNAQLQQLAHRDHLTQLANRILLIDQLEITLAHAKRNQQLVAMLYLDLDNFKPVNDEFGHKAGDEVLKTVAQRMLNCVRASDIVARLGGDEFAIVLSEQKNKQAVALIAEKIIQAISTPIRLADGRQSQLGVSIGISIFPEDALEIDHLMAYADHAMYESKRSGKNCYSFFTPPQVEGIAEILLEFKNENLSGVNLIDQQHIELVHLLNRINLAILSIADAEIVFELFDDLLAKTAQHFATEEALFEKYRLPEALSHKAEHQLLLTKLPELKNRFYSQGSEPAVLEDIKIWLLNHISQADKQALAYLLAQGAGQSGQHDQGFGHLT